MAISIIITKEGRIVAKAHTYHPIITFCSLRGYLSYLTNRDFKWKNMERKGFKQKEENTDDAETAAMKPEPATI